MTSRAVAWKIASELCEGLGESIADMAHVIWTDVDVAKRAHFDSELRKLDPACLRAYVSDCQAAALRSAATQLWHRGRTDEESEPSQTGPTCKGLGLLEPDDLTPPVPPPSADMWDAQGQPIVGRLTRLVRRHIARREG